MFTFARSRTAFEKYNQPAEPPHPTGESM